MTTLRNIDGNAAKLQLALTRLAVLDQRAEQDRIHGKITIEVYYQNGIADRVRAVMETVHK
jgi:hypothetical protein